MERDRIVALAAYVLRVPACLCPLRAYTLLGWALTVAVVVRLNAAVRRD
jgi:hypothetical protein